MSENISAVTDTNFSDEVLHAALPVLVDFWAEWCGPCRAVAPILEEIAQEYAGKLKVMKCNVDDNPQTPGQYEVRGIPTFILFKAGIAQATRVGGLSKSQLMAFIDENL